MLRPISTASITAFDEMHAAMADAIRANAAAAAHAILQARGSMSGPTIEPRTGPDRRDSSAKPALREASDPTRENGK